MLKEQLKLYAEHNFNVLLIGPHGVGKTEIIKELSEDLGYKMQYFSASTMDPWVDFIGVPKEKTENGVSYLDLVRPKAFADDDVEMIFLDELSRAHKKVVNAVFELIQFKSINGRKFNNLKLVWAAINPYDDDHTYDVERLDPALLDRFHVHIEVPNQLNRDYFNAKFEKAKIAMEWWEALPEEQKKLVSPRRLDYALQVYQQNGDLSHVLHASTNVNKLKTMLGNNISYNGSLMDLLKKGDLKLAKSFISNENNYEGCIKDILKSDELTTMFIPLLTQEKFNKLSTNNDYLTKFVTLAEVHEPILKKVNLAKKSDTIKASIESIVQTNGICLDKYTLESIKELFGNVKQDTHSNMTSYKKYPSDMFNGLFKDNMTMLNGIAKYGVPIEEGFAGVTKVKDALIKLLMSNKGYSTDTKNKIGAILNFIIQEYQEQTKQNLFELFMGDFDKLFKLLKRKSLLGVINNEYYAGLLGDN